MTGGRGEVTESLQIRVYTRATVPDSSQPPRLRARERGRARRRLRYLRQVRELQLRDAGGFVFDLYRFGEQRDALVRGKLDALIATDKEIRSLEALLGVAGRVQEIRQPGVGGTCANCGALHASEASFCAHCGIELQTAAEAAAAPPVVFADRAEPAGEDEAAAEAAEEAAPTDEEAAPAEEPAAPEPDGEVTVVAKAGHEPTVTEAPAPNGAEPGADEAQPVVKWPDSEPADGANGTPPAPDEVDLDTGEVAAVGHPDRPRARRGRARRRRGPER